MDKIHTEEAIRLTKEALTRYWMLDCEFVLSLCDHEVTWIGAQKEDFRIGYDAVSESVRSIIPEMKPCVMSCQEYYVAQNCGRACTVIGRYLVSTIPETDVYLEAWQRCVFTWEEKSGELRIKHINVSNAMGEIQVMENERFPTAVGKVSKRLLKKRMEEIRNDKKLAVTQEKGSIRFLPVQDILYAHASDKMVLIHTREEVVKVRIELQEFIKQAGDDFVLAHRSYAVNVHYVSEIERCRLQMTDGTYIPVPVKKFIEVKDALLGKKHK